METVKSSLIELSKNGKILPGDILLFKNGERGILNFLIRFAQRGGLKDYYTVKGTDNCLISKEDLDYYTAFTHAAQLGDADNDDTPWVDYIFEQYAPNARVRNLDEIPAGTLILVKRLKDRTPERIAKVMFHWKGVVKRKEPYPVSELLYFYGRWCSKIWFARKFSTVFRVTKKHHNVCSAECVCASKEGGWFRGQPDDKYYPALLASEDQYTEKVMEVIVK